MTTAATVSSPRLALDGILDESALDAALAGGVPALGVFRDALKRASLALKERFMAGTPASVLVPLRARMIDELLVRAWAISGFEDHNEHIALVAVGGYGRGELHPGSDIDLLILLAHDDHARFQTRIERFLMFLWDIGLQVGQSVRSLAECVAEATGDVTVATNVMEARLLAGPAFLVEAMGEACDPRHVWPGREFFQAKRAEQTARYRKFHDTAYNLEPNVKEGPGGLRDIQMVGWVAKRHFGTATLHGLVEEGFITETEYQSLLEGQAFLWQVRWCLHVLTGRREDRLLFDHQHAVAEHFGYRDEAHHLAIEQFMKRYYRTVMELGRLNEMLLQLFQETILLAERPARITPINGRFRARNGFLEVTSGAVFRRYPFALLELFLVLAQHRNLQGVRASTIRLIRDHRYLIDDAFRGDLRNRSLFMELLRQPRGITRELRRMNRYGILAAYLPVFGKVVGQMQYDLFHVYTVDEHTLFVVRNLRRFFIAEHAHEFPLCARIAQQLPKPELLYLAGLFHDIAKGRGGDHSLLGAADALEFCRAHGLSQFDGRLVAWLVENHLIMSAAAQREDISDPAVVNRFAARVGDPLHLNYLYLLTVADIRATNPNLWSSWKDALLIELYNATRRALRRGLGKPLDLPERIQETQEEAKKILRAHGVPRAEVATLWQTLDSDYFLRYSADEIAWHTQAIVRSSEGDMPLILVRQRTRRGGTEVFVYTHDEELLFAQTTGALDQLGLTIADARIITTRHGYTLDSYTILEEDGEPISSRQRMDEIRFVLHERLSTQGRVAAMSSRRPSRRIKHFTAPTQVSFSDDQTNQRTVMEVISTDRPGLLARIGEALLACGVRLQNAKIATIGAQVDDVFFITDPQNGPLGTQQSEALRQAIVEQLDRDAA